MKNLSKYILSALVISVVVNFFLLYQNSNTTPATLDPQVVTEQTSNNNSILDKTHKIDKQITNDGINWTGINVQQSDKDSWDAENYYELWREDENGNLLLLENFLMNFASTVSLEANPKNGINVSYYTGGPEGGITTNIVYDITGVEKLRIERETHKDYTFTFRQKDNVTYEVRPLLVEECGSEASEVMLKGVKLIKRHGLEKEFKLTSPEKVKCGFFDGSNIDPGMEILQFNDESIEFKLPNNQKSTIQLLGADDYPDSREFPEVSFE